MKKLLLAVGFTFVVSTASAAEWTETTAKLVFDGVPIGLYDQPDIGANKVKTIPSEGFPSKVWYLKTSSNSMHLIRLKPDDKELWVKGTRLELPAIEGVIELMCESQTAAKPGYSGRGLGNRSQCKEK